MLDAIVAQIKSTGHFKLVGGSADIDDDINITALPAAFVVPSSETASENSLITAVQQLITVEFAVLITARNVKTSTGADAYNAIQPLRKAIKQAIIGWQPAEEYEPVVYKSGALLKLDEDAVMWWVDTFETSFIERYVWKNQAAVT